MQINISHADRDLIRGVIDMHLHAMPCLLDRPFSEHEIALQARDVDDFVAFGKYSDHRGTFDALRIAAQLRKDLFESLDLLLGLF